MSSRKNSKKSLKVDSANAPLVFVLILAVCIAIFFIYQSYSSRRVDDVTNPDIARSAAIERLDTGSGSAADRERQLQRLNTGITR